MWVEVILIGLAVGILVGLMGIGGGIVLVPAMVYVLKLNQHMAQGTSLFLQLPPVGVGALYLYWKKGNVNVKAGLVCAAGFLLGGYAGSLMALGLPAQQLRSLFGVFLMIAAWLLWRETSARAREAGIDG